MIEKLMSRISATLIAWRVLILVDIYPACAAKDCVLYLSIGPMTMTVIDLATSPANPKDKDPINGST